MSAIEGAAKAISTGRRRWLALGVIGIAQLMVVLDLTVMNIALPSAQRALHFTTWRSAVFYWSGGSWPICLAAGRRFSWVYSASPASQLWAAHPSTSPCW
jgi:hypothetical protein